MAGGSDPRWASRHPRGERPIWDHRGTAPVPQPAPPPAPPRHCWVVDWPGAPGRWPAILLEWRRSDRGWQARVLVAFAHGGDVTTVDGVIPAEYLRPGP